MGFGLRMMRVLLLAVGTLACQSQMYKAEAVNVESIDSETDTGTVEPEDSDVDSESDTDDKPGPDETWVNLTVNCDLEECQDAKNLKFYADALEENLDDLADFYNNFGEVSFPFNILLKETSNMLNNPYDWPNFKLVGGAYLDMDEEDYKVAGEIDPQTTGNVFNFEKGKINDVVLTLDDKISADDVWIDLTINCDEVVCQETGKSLHFALYDGDEQTGAPDYYIELKDITYPFHKVIRRMTDVFTYPKYLPVGNVTGGGYHDTIPDDATNGLPNPTIDPTDLYNTYPLKKGVLNYMNLNLNLLPKEADIWIKLTVYCDDPLCDQDKKLRFYAFDGTEETGEPDYFNTFENVTFPFHAMIKTTASYAQPGTPKTLPQATISGGAFYDIDPESGIFDAQDPQSRGTKLTLKAGDAKEMVLTLVPDP